MNESSLPGRISFPHVTATARPIQLFPRQTRDVRCRRTAARDLSAPELAWRIAFYTYDGFRPGRAIRRRRGS
jgi:hypothetical protein